ncbi:MAG: hypothetical protein ACTSPD_08100 [Promethearchaeota archaeon]
MRFECPNCGCIVNFGYKQDMINLIIQKLRIKTRVVLCTIADDEGFIIASDAGYLIDKKLERKVVSFYKAINNLADKTGMLIDFQKKIEVFKLIEEFDKQLKGFFMILKSINRSTTLISIVPSWLNIAKVSIEFEKAIIELKKLCEADAEFNINEIKENILIH